MLCFMIVAQRISLLDKTLKKGGVPDIYFSKGSLWYSMSSFSYPLTNYTVPPQEKLNFMESIYVGQSKRHNFQLHQDFYEDLNKQSQFDHISPY